MEELSKKHSGRWIETGTLPRRWGVFRGLLLLTALLALALLVGGRSPARADTDLGPLHASGEATVGGRAVTGDWGSSKFDEFRDLRPGLLGGGSFLLEDEKQRYYMKGFADFVGELDQRYDLGAGRYNWFRVETYFEQYPNTFSNDANSLYQDIGSGNLILSNSIQKTIQNAAGTASKSRALKRALDAAPHVDLQYKLRETGVRLTLQPLPELALKAGYRLQERVGTRPWGMGMGSPGSNFVNVAAPIDERTHELTAGIGYNREAGDLQLNYLGSFFENDLDALVVDNPLRLQDSGTAGPSRGRTVLSPDNSAHSLTLSGGVKLPVDFPARLTGTLSYGRRFQNEDFLPHTINTASTFMNPLTMLPRPSLVLPRQSFDGDVRTWLGNVRLATRPTNKLSITGSYRIYDLDNQSPVLTFPAHVINDQSLVSEPRKTVASDYRVQNADLDASYRLFKNRAKLKLGGGWEQWNRSDDREVRRLVEYVGRTGLEVKIGTWANLRASYKFGIRRGNKYHTFAHLEHHVLEEPDDVSLAQSQSLQVRKFDEADREHRQVDLLAQIDPRDDLELTLTGSYSNDDYLHTDLGLKGFRSWSFGGDAAYTPFGWLTLSPFYTYELSKSKQASRWRPVQSSTGIVIDDPRNNWSAMSLDRVFTAGMGAHVELIQDRLDLDVNYMIQHATGESLASAVPRFRPAPPFTSTVDAGDAVNFPDLKDVLQTASATLNYHMRDDVTWHLGYTYERFDLRDFKTDDLQPFMPYSNINASGVMTPSTDIFLGNRVGDYAAHIMMLSATYRF